MNLLISIIFELIVIAVLGRLLPFLILCVGYVVVGVMVVASFVGIPALAVILVICLCEFVSSLWKRF